ncbi:hypothetical protein Syun_022603 [Stephania yunnanensis]|uniref:Inositol polyphosphate-related phosphatase domain-containing protein n=1 Tax=Stephania yunnanensis TaxID=152371 RepID=A0AAP0FEQ2_9MAGN
MSDETILPEEPSSDQIQGLPIPLHSNNSSLDIGLYKDSRDTTTSKKYNTWNVGGIIPPDDFDMEDLLETSNDICDIYVLGFQEIVPLSAGNVLGVEKSRISMKWNSLIRTALNSPKTYSAHDQKKTERKTFPQTFQCIVSKNMVGILISIWVRIDLRQYIEHPSVSCVGCGIMGCLGNKGSVSVRFRLHQTSFCFVCGHLASGGKEGNERHRNSDAAEILGRTRFPRGPSNDLPRHILDHEISLPEASTRSMAEKGEWGVLLDNDQLRVELKVGHVFEGWHEGAIGFAPTYKYYPNSDVYYGCIQTKKGEKRRAPAWCDRILWYGKGLKQKTYDRGEVRLSDHRPVQAVFSVDVEVSKASKGSFRDFLSDRFERISHNFELLSTDDFMMKGRSSFQSL